MLDTFPLNRPNTPLLDQIDTPDKLRNLSVDSLTQLAHEVRLWLLYSTAQTGGHFGAGLGVVELTLALHHCLNTPDDFLVWDVGHQCYPHKILTGRKEAMLSMRQAQGLAPFPKPDESPYDAFGTGHSSTSISAALGAALAFRLKGLSHKSVAVIGDGAMTAGMAFEALNHAAHTQADLLVILNDNDMSISRNEGGLATYLANNLKNKTDGKTTAALFEALAFEYTGPIDGHNLSDLIVNLDRVLVAKGPQFLHVITRKGKGYAPAEADPVGFHAISKIDPLTPPNKPTPSPKFCNIFGRWICQKAATDSRIVAITPAMREGSDLVRFSEMFPDRYFDVAIAEQHAVTFAAGLAIKGMKPVVAIYSTFLQRAYDQVIHDVAIQKLDVLFAVDRAGLVGEDGATHAGNYDLAFLRTLPNMTLLTPANEAELVQALEFGYQQSGPVAVRYPRGTAETWGLAVETPAYPEPYIAYQGSKKIALLNFGPLLARAQAVAEALDISVVDMRCVKPLHSEILTDVCRQYATLVTLEDHSLSGGAGSAISEFLHANRMGNKLVCLGIPDEWIEHATREEQLDMCGLSIEHISERILALRNE